jgi:uncharacterized protein YggT (Ycf19 family)
MQSLASMIDALLKLFALGLFVRAALTWVRDRNTKKVEEYLDHIYAPFLAPIRKVVKPIQVNTSPPSALDLAPLILLLLVWWVVNPFLMWLLT